MGLFAIFGKVLDFADVQRPLEVGGLASPASVHLLCGSCDWDLN